jgi:hypothetical protein
VGAAASHPSWDRCTTSSQLLPKSSSICFIIHVTAEMCQLCQGECFIRIDKKTVCINIKF